MPHGQPAGYVAEKLSLVTAAVKQGMSRLFPSTSRRLRESSRKEEAPCVITVRPAAALAELFLLLMQLPTLLLSSSPRHKPTATLRRIVGAHAPLRLPHGFT